MKTQDNYLSIFLVDDDAMFLKALKYKLHEKFKSVVKINAFQTAEECLLHIQEKPDVVVLDYYLDGLSGKSMNGIQALRQIKTVSDDITVVMLSGEDKKEVIEESLRSGASQYVAKSTKATGIIQDILNRKVHENLEEKNAKENARLNYITLAAFLAFAGGLILLFLKYR
jgi:two-component system OmpR family response regulator